MSLNIEFVTADTGNVLVHATSDQPGTNYAGVIHIGVPVEWVFAFGWGMRSRYTPAQQLEIEAAASKKATLLNIVRRLTT
ncbi:MAG: hypothetical protein HQ445_08125 [Polaromonas sp.]|nr:hypothetical protein [Polaromonas sp.]